MSILHLLVSVVIILLLLLPGLPLVAFIYITLAFLSPLRLHFPPLFPDFPSPPEQFSSGADAFIHAPHAAHSFTL